MVWNYQNEIAPIFYYGISTKTNEKDLKIPSLQPSDWKNPYWMSLYEVIEVWADECLILLNKSIIQLALYISKQLNQADL